MIKILDLGCGKNALGYAPLRETSNAEVFHVDISKNAYHLEVCSDAHHLPFKDKSFDVVYASHILEHLDSPLKGLSEMKRVSKNFVIIRVPNAIHFRVTYETPEHIYSWSESSLEHLLKRFFHSVKIVNSLRIADYERSDKIRTLKRLLLSIFLRNNELTAICMV